MADEQRKDADENGYELNLDDTVSSWDEVVEEAVAAVDKVDDQRTEQDDVAGGDRLENDSQARSLREQLVRTLADFDNYRKRTEREKTQMRRYALFDVLKDFLDVYDNLERALAASGSTGDLKTGVEMIARQFSDLLRRYGVEPIEAVGRPFDPTVHEAVTREESSEVDAPTVTAELQRGYRLHERLLRPAMVAVAMPVESGGEEAAEAEGRNDQDGVGETVEQATEAN